MSDDPRGVLRSPLMRRADERREEWAKATIGLPVDAVDPAAEDIDGEHFCRMMGLAAGGVPPEDLNALAKAMAHAAFDAITTNGGNFGPPAEGAVLQAFLTGWFLRDEQARAESQDQAA